MDIYPWWTDEQKAFAEEAHAFVRELMPRDAESRWKREFPWDIFEKIGERGFTGAGVPREYGGLGLGATGACIAAEAFSRMPGPGRVFIGNMLGGLRQIIEFGSEEQKKRFLPRIARGEMGAIVITEPVAGTDAAAIEMTARREGDVYLLNGKKRYIVSAGVAQRYMVYARTSENPEDRKRYRHLTAFVVEKGSPGFSVEKINEIIGFENIQNGALDFKDVPVPKDQVLGEEGQGWSIMTAGLNFERTLICAQTAAWMGELLRNAVPYAERRVQFGRPTISFVNNQFKIADMVSRVKISRLLTYYTAYLWDLGWDITLESNVAKVYNCEGAVAASLDAIQVMGGDGLTPFYPVSAIYGVSKVENIAGGTMEACRMVIQRAAMKQMAEDLKMCRRVIHEELGVPVPAAAEPGKSPAIDEEGLLKILAEDYRANPGLHMSREDIKAYFDVDDKDLDRVLVDLEGKGYVRLVRDKKGIALAKASYEGLGRAFPLDYYKWFPSWIDEGRVF
ncbi:Acyl-CoA dehydrogenase family protein [uncultured Desulfatiglans sp.]|uniref:Acyl-CoA dehydrogenase family protein n=1 Tax=Uncultured Desulfatiglans sp. TaxID=1748965 RepID=A0A653A6P5_UNCDX|nr:Acyl-CoA dehydrogenase family protein [uncultured Desulfatiglans sp.]